MCHTEEKIFRKVQMKFEIEINRVPNTAPYTTHGSEIICRYNGHIIFTMESEGSAYFENNMQLGANFQTLDKFIKALLKHCPESEVNIFLDGRL